MGQPSKQQPQSATSKLAAQLASKRNRPTAKIRLTSSWPAHMEAAQSHEDSGHRKARAWLFWSVHTVLGLSRFRIPLLNPRRLQKWETKALLDHSRLLLSLRQAGKVPKRRFNLDHPLTAHPMLKRHSQHACDKGSMYQFVPKRCSL